MSAEVFEANHERIYYATSSIYHNDVKFGKRKYKSDNPFVLFLNGNLFAQGDDKAFMNRLYQRLAGDREYSDLFAKA